MRSSLALLPALAGAVLTLLAGTTVSFAQNALGDGRGLERDLRVGGGGLSARPDIVAEARMRNAVVTGNVGGGRHFRGNVGYIDSEEFHGRLGTDDLYGFRRDSVQSQYGLRGTQSLQYQYSLTTGNTQSATGNEVFVDRYTAGYGPTSIKGAMPNTNVRPAMVRSEDRDSDTTGDPAASGAALYAPLRLGSMRSTGSYTANRSLSPAVVAYRQTELGTDRITASSLLGVRQLNDERVLSRLTERRRLEVEANRADNPLSTSVPPPTTMESRSAGPDFRTAYQDLRDRISSLAPSRPAGDERPKVRQASEEVDPARAAREADAPAMPPTWEEQMDALRARMVRRSEMRAKGLTEDESVKLTPEEAKEAAQAPDDDTLRVIRDAGGEVNSYFSGEPGSLFGEHLRAGQELMVVERYFDAEERFARALAMRPGDVTVMAARLHAQIGAGLYTSAALNLRELFTNYPEVIGVKYRGATIPPKYRLVTIAGELRENLAKARRTNATVPTESALLLGYIGFQLGDQAMVREGLTDLRGVLIPDPIVATLEGVWLVAKPAAPAPAPAPDVSK